MNSNKYKCILCSSKLLKKIHNFGKQPASNSYKTRLTKKEYLHELVLCKCTNCNLIQIFNPIPINKIRIPLTTPLTTPPIMNAREISRLDRGACIKSGTCPVNFICKSEEEGLEDALVSVFIMINPGIMKMV